MNNYLIITIVQYILVIISYILLPIYVKNAGKYLLGNLSRKAIPVFLIGIILTMISLAYLIYHLGADENLEISSKNDKIYLTCYLFFAALSSIFLILYASYKNPILYYSNKIILFTIAGLAIALLVNLLQAWPYNTHDKFAIASASIITIQTLVGDALVWSWYFPKLH